jgi:hypothetical protein
MNDLLIKGPDKGPETQSASFCTTNDTPGIDKRHDLMGELHSIHHMKFRQSFLIVIQPNCDANQG